jgi:cytochrome P450
MLDLGVRRNIVVQKPILHSNNYWHVSRYHDIKLVLEEENSSKDYLKWIDLNNAPKNWLNSFHYKELLASQNGELARLGFVMEDNPERAESMKNLMHLFSKNNVEKVTSFIRDYVKETVSKNLNNKDFDLVNDLSINVTYQVTSNLLGIPEITEVIDTVEKHCQTMLDTSLCPDWIKPYSEKTLMDIELAKEFFAHFLTPIIIDRLKNPKDDFLSNYFKNAGPDVLRAGVSMVGLICLMSTVGLGTSDLLFFLAKNKDVQKNLRQQKKLTLENFEELARISGHIPTVIRVLKKDVVIENIIMKKGMFVVLEIGAAGFDPSFVTNPNELDLNRSFANNLSFGHGVHACGGKAIGRSVLRAVVEETLAGTVDLNVTGKPVLSNNGSTNHFLSIPFSLEG